MRFQSSAASALAAAIASTQVGILESYRVLPRDSSLSGENASLVEQQITTGEIPDELEIDSVLDLSDNVFQGQKEVKVGGKSYRCCSKQKGDVSVLVHVEQVKEKGMAWWAELSTSLGGSTGCTQLLGRGYHSWTHWSGNKCQVLESALPEELAGAPWIPQNRLYSVMDLTSLFVDPRTRKEYKDTKLPNGKSYRCCTKSASKPGKVVDTTGPDKSGWFAGRCEHLAGDDYHSWPSWKDGSCLADSKHVPKDLLNHLTGIVSGGISIKPGGDDSQDGGGSATGPDHGGSHGTNPGPTPAPAVQGSCSGNLVKVRVVEATTAQIIEAMPVTIHLQDGSVQGEKNDGKTQANGMATFCVPGDVKKIKVVPSRSDYMFYSRQYDLTRQCRGGRCTLQCAMQETW